MKENKEMHDRQQRQVPLHVIRAKGMDLRGMLADIIKSRYMFWNVVKTSAIQPYTDMFIGYLWPLFRPFVFMAVMVFIKRHSKAQLANELSYNLFVFSGLVLWWYFVDAAKQSSRSLFKYKSIITKIYFPRVIVPAIPVLSRLFDLVIQGLGLAGMIIYESRYPGIGILWLPLIIVNVVVLALAVGYLASAITPFIRDIERVLDHILYTALFLSPVIFSVTMIPEKYHRLYTVLNPMSGPLMAFRSALFDMPFDWTSWIISGVVSLCMLFAGLLAFIRVEGMIAEKVL
jgi:lipopolysaccharide transport system permease protein